ncbi:hypothetical protein PPYR_13092 [Photinus pyralis]|uniref:Bee-milk protein n=1 Tax=Photinus pyralis TaxID=7054 RepID=A0A1Y1LKD1_PHOPY|nr:protein yellow-like isoform X2 [Photinus pyralis]XP_031353221.1 protein yellow-like isoform X2 [Photinus pyralis]XP_031353222.1 protein yellow-like isoform X2 [Photinus pyralis]XP_031353223.1 protein yellow-like isoform X2 [Photinus pyralis]XP_031353224.1 protein yellow-like isoform X2 [Photinus pyralis]KAB0793472.1 hypothetical protein PPYR_13092 [Photinus pyralis]
MAVAHSWFQSWQPPTGLITDTRHIHTIHPQPHGNRQRANYHHGSSPNIIGFLPYLASLGVMSPGLKDDSHVNYKAPTEPNLLESTGPLKTRYLWKQVDFAYPSEEDRQNAIESGEFVQKNNLPLGIEIDKDRIFVSFPKWKDGTPCTLATIPKSSNEISPPFEPYPNWDWHNKGTCEGLVSVYRMQIDQCNRLWVLDSGQINVIVKPEQACRPKIVIFDLATDNLILRYELPDEFIKQDGLFSNLAVDIQKNRCDDAYAYAVDVWRYGLVVFSLKERRSWRLTDHLFYPDPLAAAYELHGLKFEWTDGIFSLALSPDLFDKEDRLLYFHPLSSFREFYVKTSSIKNETEFNTLKRQVRTIGESRGKDGHASSSVIDRNGVMLFSLVSKDSIACWDLRKPYRRRNLATVAKSNITLVFPNDLKLDKEHKQSVWVLSNRLPFFLYSNLGENDYNFRIMSALVNEAIRDTICDPSVVYEDTYSSDRDHSNCY